MRSPLKAGPFLMEINAKGDWFLSRKDGTVYPATISMRADELNQLGRVVEKARKYRNTTKRLRSERAARGGVKGMEKTEERHFNVSLPGPDVYVSSLIRTDLKPCVHFKIGTEYDAVMFASSARAIAEALIEQADAAERMAEAIDVVSRACAASEEREAEKADTAKAATCSTCGLSLVDCASYGAATDSHRA